MHHANRPTTIHRRPSTTKQSSHHTTFVKPPDLGGHSNVATDRIASSDALRPCCGLLVASCPRRRRVPRLDGSIVQVVPGIFPHQKYPFPRGGIGTLHLIHGSLSLPPNRTKIGTAIYAQLTRVHNRQTDTWTTIRCDSCSNEPHLTGVKLSFLFIYYNLNYATLLVNNK